MGEAPRRPELALTIVRLASRWVPRLSRRAWLREWEGEVLGRWGELEARGSAGLGARLDLLARAMGSAVDALSYDGGRWTMGGWIRHLRTTARGLVRRPGFTTVLVLTLGIGIGANTAILGIARDVLLRPFPYPDPDRVVAVESLAVGREDLFGNVAYPNLADLDQAASSFAAVGGTRWWEPALEDERGAVVLRGATVTANFFDILGVEAGQGRFFRPGEAGTGREPLAVVSHALWLDRFGGDPALVGRDLRLSGTTYRVVGVTSAEFEDPWIMDRPGAEPQVWRTVASPPSEWPRSGRSWKGIARVRPEVSVDAAQEELDALWAGLAEAFPEHNANRIMRIVPLRELVAGPAEPVLMTLVASVALLLLVTCANLANLLLGRTLDRHFEFAVHRALGAPEWTIVGRSLSEALVLAAGGGVLGLGLAVWLGRLARDLGPLLPRPVTGAVDVTVLGFALGVTLLAALLFGLAPALLAARPGLVTPGREATRAFTATRRGRRLRRALVVGELALTTALLIGAGLLVRDVHRLGRVELGVETDGTVAMELHGSAWWDLEPDAAEAKWTAVLEGTRSVTGVRSAGAIDYVPLGGDYSCDGIERSDRPPPGPGEGRCAEVRVVLPGALDAMGIPLLRGRLLRPDDGRDAPAVALIDRTAAERFWPGEDPLGRRFLVHTREHEVVGIVGDMLHFGPGEPPRPMVYLHAPQEGWNGIARGLSLVIRGTGSDDLIAPVREAVARVDPSIAVGAVDTFESLVRANLAATRFRTALMAAFAVTALLLALLGIAGVMGYSVARRAREMGLRLALGAQPAEVRVLVLSEGVRLVVAGVVLGLLGSLAVAGALDTLLVQVSARDPLVYTATVALLAAAAIVACYLPARRASRVDPLAALVVD